MMDHHSIPVVVVAGDADLRAALLTGLANFGFEVRGAGDGVELDAALAQKPAQIVLLDADLPKESGLAIAARLQGNPALGIVLLASRSLPGERIKALESGADHCFLKPVDLSELAVTMKNLGRRLVRPEASNWIFKAEASRLRTPNGITLSLTAQECILLDLLFSHLGNSVPRQQIFKALGQPDDLFSAPRLEVLVSRLRSKVQKADPAVTLPLRARSNRGYILLAEDGR